MSIVNAGYLGDYQQDDTLTFMWTSLDSNGASITRSTDGTISVYKDGDTTQSVAGITDTEDFDSLTGVHMCQIDLSSDAFYVGAADYTVVLSAATIDAQTVNSNIGHFSIENRFQGAVGVGSGSINKSAESYVLTTGVQSANTVASTTALDGTNHEHTDTAGAMDLYYQFDVTGEGIPTSVQMTGYLNGNNDDLEVYAFVWGSSSWGRIGTLDGQAAANNAVHTFDLLTTHVGTGANLGKVRIRFTDGAFTLTSATLAVDQIFVSYAILRSAVGYANGAIYVNTGASNTNTEVGVDGVADNPVSTWAAALTLNSSLGLNKFQIVNGSSITLTGNSDNYTILGDAWTLALGGQSIAGIKVAGADVSGIGTGATEPQFENCHFGATTIPPSQFQFCGFEGTITIGTAGTFFFDDCHSAIAGVATPILDFGSALNASEVNFRRYSGGIEVQNMGAGTGAYRVSLEGFGQLIINANCSATSDIAIRGLFTVTDNASAAVTLSEDARYAESDLISALKASTGWTAGGTATFATIIKKIFGMAQGKITVSSNVYTFFDDDGTTELFDLTIGSTSRTTS